jgi:hypothetical protein
MDTEQMFDIELEQDEVEQPEPVAAIEPVAEPEVRAVAEAETPTFDLTTPEGVRKAAEQFPAFQAVFADERNRAAQKAKTDLLRERGTLESIQAHNAEAIRRLSLGEDPNEIAKDTPLYVKANADLVRLEMFKNLYEKTKEIDPDAVAALEGFAEQEDLSPDQWQNLAQAAMNAVAQKSVKTGKESLLSLESLDDIPKDSPLWRAIDAHLTKEREAEVTAENITATQKPNPPSAPQGTVAAGGKTATEIAAMTSKQFDALSEEEIETALKTLYEAARS